MNKLMLLFEFIQFLFTYKDVVVVGFTLDKDNPVARYTSNCKKDQAVEVTEVLESTIDRMNSGIAQKQQQARQDEGDEVLNEIMSKWKQEQFKTE